MELAGYGRKLAGMGADEVRVRGLQALRKRWDRVRGAPAVRRHRDTGRAPNFFFDAAGLEAILGVLRLDFPGAVTSVRERADMVLRHRFDLLGYRDLDYGQDIDWHWDAVHQRRTPRKPWYKIRMLDFAEVGDSKVTAELSRHHHLVTLAQAFCLFGARGYAEELMRQWRSWQRANPYGRGLNWASSLEVAFRSLNWLWVRALLAGRGALEPPFAGELERALGVNARHIERYLSTYSSPNTHLVGEGVGLFFIGTLCPRLAGAGRWREHGWTIVLDAARLQVLDDGMYFEQSVYYHVYALDFFLHARILAARNGVKIPPGFDATLERMLAALHLLTQTGPPPRSGDDDGGRVFDPNRNRVEHLADPLSTGALLYRRPEWRTDRPPGVETVWLLGAEAAPTWGPRAPQPQRPAARRLEASGLHVMAEGGGKRLIVDAGPIGWGRAGHGHADALSLELSDGTHGWLTDPGTCCYLSGGSERERFRGTAAHNTMEIDGQDQAEAAGRFAWRHLPRVTVHAWEPGNGFSYFRGSHDGYGRLTPPVVHERRVFHLHDAFWLVVDRAQGQGSHTVALNWHFGAELMARELRGGGWELEAMDGAGWVVLPARVPGWLPQLKPGVVSPAYGTTEAAMVGRLSRTGELPAEMATLLAPAPGSQWKLERGSDSEDAAAYRVWRDQELHGIVFADRGRTWHVDGWSSDGELLYCAPEGPEQRRLVLCGASFLSFQGNVLLPRGPRRERWELDVEAATLAAGRMF